MATSKTEHGVYELLRQELPHIIDQTAGLDETIEMILEQVEGHLIAAWVNGRNCGKLDCAEGVQRRRNPFRRERD